MSSSYLDRVFRATETENRRVILRSLGGRRGGRLLDLGCGDGSFTIELAERAAAEEVHGVEYVGRVAEQAEQRGIRVQQADLNGAFPYPDAHFDVVHSNQVIEHIQHTDSFLKETKRVLRPGGTAIVSTNNLSSWHNIAALLLGWQPLPAHVSDEVLIGNPVDPYRMVTKDDPGQTHLRIFTGRGLRELAEYHSLTVTQVRGVGYYPLPVRPARLMSRIDPRHAAFLVLVASRD